jgi:uncharacterized protein with ATP-grasp and redox domains
MPASEYAMETYLDCIPCFFRQALATARVATPDPMMQRRVLNSVAFMMPDLPLEVSPPEIAQNVYRIVREVTGNSDPYHDIKARANAAVLKRYFYLKELINRSESPMKTACKLAIAGNCIDLGPSDQIGEVDSIITEGLGYYLDSEIVSFFRQCVQKASRIVYLADNAGEIVFDRLLIEQMLNICQAEIILAVREKPVLNDATLSDAQTAEMQSIATLVTNGSDAPGTILSQCSDSMLGHYDAADLIVAKGQGNYESLNDRNENIFFLLKVKCPVIARSSGYPLGTPVLQSRLHLPVGV